MSIRPARSTASSALLVAEVRDFGGILLLLVFERAELGSLCGDDALLGSLVSMVREDNRLQPDLHGEVHGFQLAADQTRRYHLKPGVSTPEWLLSVALTRP